MNSFVSSFVRGSVVDPNATWANSTYAWSSSFATDRDWNSIVNPSTVSTVAVKWRAADTTGALSSASYTDFLPSYRSFRYAQFKLEATRSDLLLSFQFDTLNTLIDVPDVVDSGTATVGSTSGQTIAFTQTFNTPNPATDIFITVAIVGNSSGGDFLMVHNITATNFKVTVYDNSGSPVTGRTVNWIARGY